MPSALFTALNPKPIGVTRVAVASPPLVFFRAQQRDLETQRVRLRPGRRREGLGQFRPQRIGHDHREFRPIRRADTAVELRVRAIVDGGRLDDHRTIFCEHASRLRIGPGFAARLVLSHLAGRLHRDRGVILGLGQRCRRASHQCNGASATECKPGYGTMTRSCLVPPPIPPAAHAAEYQGESSHAVRLCSIGTNPEVDGLESAGLPRPTKWISANAARPLLLVLSPSDATAS